MSRISWLAAFAAAFLPAFAGAASDNDPEIAQLRAELASLKETYDARIASLEARLSARAVPTEEVSAPPPLSMPPTSSGAFNPAVSLILDGKYRAIERNPQTYQIGGFIPGGEEIGPGNRSADLGESELVLSANIDPYFAGYFVTAFTPEGEAEVEEAYLTHLGLVPGATLRFGRFLSAFGYLNEFHAHAWDFVDAPLAMQAFLGSALKEDGVQLRWLAPTDLFAELGIELGRGEGFPGSDRNRNTPNSAMVFAHIGGDVGSGSSYRIGGSYRRVNAEGRAYDDIDAAGASVTNLFSGDVDMWGLDAVWKWSPDGNPLAQNLKLQAEYYDVKSDGSLLFDADGAALDGDFESGQRGWYAQAVYQFIPRWRMGMRYDALDSSTLHLGLVSDGTLTAADFPLLAGNEPTRWTTMVDFSPTEFSRLRLQYALDDARFDGTDHQLFLQYIMSMGAHGAHKF